MTTRPIGFACLPLLFAFACSTAPNDRDPSATSSSDALRALSASEIVGSIDYGETKANLAYDDSATYRALSFQGASGDEIAIDVQAANADARAWLLGADFRTLAANDDASAGVRDAHIERRLGRTGTYYIAFREKSYEDASFTVSLRRTNALPEPTPAPAPAPAPTPSDDPLDAGSCPGPADANPAALFSSGATEHSLGQSKVVWQGRRCNDVTGCTSWHELPSKLDGVEWQGPVSLEVRNGGIDVDFSGLGRDDYRTLVALCHVSGGGALHCEDAMYRGSDSIALAGVMNEHCLRVWGVASSAIRGGDGTIVAGEHNEWRLGMLARF